MKKIAIIVDGAFDTPRGQENAELNRIKHLKDIADYQIDVYSFTLYEWWLVRLLRHTKAIKRPRIKHFENFDMHFYWHKFSLIDWFLTVKKNRAPIVNKSWALKYYYLFKDYDLISAHSERCGEVALKAYQEYKVPYCVTWHGSDIHTSPFSSKYVFDLTKRIMDAAEANFMVSCKLKEISEKISTVDNKVVLYNGIGTEFSKYEDTKRSELRKQYNVENKKVVAFAGNLLAVKNPMSLPEIFKHTYSKYNGVEFWIMGSGKFFDPLKQKCEEYGIPVVFLGNVPSEKMPNRFNCVDVLVLPSINEGLPLVVVEALACGANVVGSKAGGIPEVIGEENSFDKEDEHFAENVADRIVCMLTSKVEQNLDSKFSWVETAKNENEIYQKILKKL